MRLDPIKLQTTINKKEELLDQIITETCEIKEAILKAKSLDEVF